MKKIAFKNPKGGTIYLAKVGFDWGAFWGLPLLGGLPFFLRKMPVLGAFCLAFLLVITIAIGHEDIRKAVVQEEIRRGVIQEELSDWEKGAGTLFYSLLTLGVSLYLGFRGGKLTARHYVEEGYECVTKDETLLTRAKAKWGLEI